MSCRHCLRGDAQNIDIDQQLIEETIKQCSDISNITFTGGEPSLNTKALEFTLKTLKKYNKHINSFYVVTNAKKYNNAFVNVLNQYYMYCLSSEFNNLSIIEPTDVLPNIENYEFDGGLAVSHDKYHDPIPAANYLRYTMLKYYVHNKERLSDDYILDMGNAHKNKLGKFPCPISELHIDEYNNGCSIDMLYLNAKGDILADCDLSYDEQPKHTYGNIINDSLIDIIERNR